MKIKKNILYLSFDGITDPLGRSQILPLITELSKNYIVNLLTIEKKLFFNSTYKNISKTIIKNNIKHYKINFYKNYFLKILSYIYYFFIILKIIILNKIELIHVRGYQPLIFLYPIKFLKKIKIIFDIRGFWPEEKIDRNNWSKKNFIYKFFKKIENIFIKYSTIIICLTNHSKQIIIKSFNIENKKIYVIPTCSDEIKFNINKFLLFNKNNIEKEIIKIGYLGTTIGAYNFNSTLKIIKLLLDNNIKIHFLIYTHDNKEDIIKKLNSHNILKKHYSILNISYDKIDKHLNKLDFIIFFLNQNYSIKASFPTKISEVFLCGLPIICNNFNNDIAEVIKNNDFIYGLDDKNLDFNSLKKFIYKIYNNQKKYKVLINDFAKKNYENKIAFKNYINIYKKIINE